MFLIGRVTIALTSDRSIYLKTGPFRFYDKILQIYRQHWIRRILQTYFIKKLRKFQKSGRGVYQHLLNTQNTVKVYYGANDGEFKLRYNKHTVTAL